ncbi:MAG TPA: undecaprenyl-diphosphate phosphatase, partial [Acidimicrobiales bacterium]|nr:undecaprenyl-diphosphate phosphatase [Acidimicrobiales bacterium]
ANGLILLLGERARRVSETREARRAKRLALDSQLAESTGGAGYADSGSGQVDRIYGAHAPFDLPSGKERSRALATMEFKESVVIGVAQILALLAGISRSGVTMVAGLMRGLNYEDAARFSFLLATPIIMAAGVLKVPDLMGHLGNGIRGQALVGSIAAFIAAYVAIRFLSRYFETRNLKPFAYYSLGVGVVLSLVFGL